MRFLENQLMNFWFNLKKTSGVLCYNQGLDREENIKLTVKIYIVSTIYVRNFAKKCPGSLISLKIIKSDKRGQSNLNMLLMMKLM